ncbi:MAG: hypothetical protein ABIH11_05935 [Candidatus Altiarchaeota archaeon]
MKFIDWMHYDFPLNEAIIGGGHSREVCGYDGMDPPQKHPIGINPSIRYEAVKNALDDTSRVNTRLCHHGFFQTDAKRPERREILETLAGSDVFSLWFKLAVKLDYRMGAIPERYFKTLVEHRFVVSPRGIGEDCYRTYEALLCKAIPIIQEPVMEGSFITEKYSGLPVVYTRDYSELSREYLNGLYDDILETDYDFDKLSLTYWTGKSPTLRRQMEYWLRFHDNTSWYSVLGMDDSRER